jgi:hypothetical protein
MTGNKPIKTYRLGHISVSIFQNEVEAREGNGTRSLYSVQLQKRTRDEQGNWKTVPMLNLPDLPLAQRVLTQAQSFLEQQEDPAAT